MEADDRIVITGVGVVSPLGIGLPPFHQALAEGKSGVVPLDCPWQTGYSTNRAGLVPDFVLSHFMPLAGGDCLGRTTQLALVAGDMALQSAGLARANPVRHTGVIVGTALGESLAVEHAWEAAGVPVPAQQAPLQMANAMHEADLPDYNIHDTLATMFDLAGPNHVVTTACAAGNHAIAWACDLLKSGAADAMLAIGVDTIPYVDLLGFSRLLLQAPDCCRPFDLRRKGTILAEGAGALALEPLTLARRRGADILAEVAGCGLSCDAAGTFSGRIQDIRSLTIAAQRALHEARCHPEEIDYISAHASGTRLNDAKETHFIKELLGDHAYRVPVSGIKSMLGHAQGAAASFEAIASVLSLTHDVLYPTINYETPDPQCDLDYVPNQARHARVDVIMSHAFGVGGNNAIVIFKRWKGK